MIRKILYFVAGLSMCSVYAHDYRDDLAQHAPMFGIDVTPTFIKEFQQTIFVEGVHTQQGRFVMSQMVGDFSGSESLYFPYSYSNNTTHFNTDGFHIFNHYFAYGSLGFDEPRITCCDSDGGYLEYQTKPLTLNTRLRIDSSEFERGFVNTGSGLISGKTNLKNNCIITTKRDKPRSGNDVPSMEEDVFRLHLGDGGQRIYRRAKKSAVIEEQFSISRSFKTLIGWSTPIVKDFVDQSFIKEVIKTQYFALQYERKSNGNWIEYILDENGARLIPKEIKLWDSERKKELASLKVEVSEDTIDKDRSERSNFQHYRYPLTVHSSDGNETKFICGPIGSRIMDIITGDILLRATHDKRKNHTTLFTYYQNPSFDDDSQSYFHDPFPIGPLKNIIEPENKTTELVYYIRDESIPVKHFENEIQDKRARGLVKSIHTPRGKRWFEYEIDSQYNEKSHNTETFIKKTNVYEEHSQQAACYIFSKARRPETISYYTSPKEGIQKNGGRTLVYGEKYIWDDQGKYGNLLQKSIFDEKGVFGNRWFRYDNFGNVLEEKLSGDLSGTKNKREDKETYTKNYTYSNDGFNNVLSIEETNGIKKTFRYKKETDLLEATFHWNEGKIVLREFRFYDTAAILIKQIVDDGTSEDVEDLPNITRRMMKEISPKQEQPAFGQPEVIESKYLDLSTNQYHLLQRVEFTYGECHQPTCIKTTGANGETMSKTFVYDERGNVIKEIDTLGNETLFEYDRANRRIQTSIPSLNYVFRVKYNPNDQVLEEEKIENGKSYIKKYEYSPEGYKTAEIDENGNKTHIESEFKGRPNKIIFSQILNEKGEIVTPTLHQKFDASGNLIEKQSPNGESTKSAYTFYNKPIFIEYPDGTREEMSYFLDGKLKTKKTKTGSLISYTYDWQGRLISEEHTDPHTNEIRQNRYEYTTLYKIKKIDALNNTTHYEYDCANRLIKKVKSDGKTIEYVYDGLSRKTKENVYANDTLEYTIELTYDALNRITKKVVFLPNGDIQFIKNYTFDCLGRVIKESYDNAFATYKKYDIFNRVIETKNEANQTTTHTFTTIQNSLGQIVDQHIIKDPNGKESIKTFDVLGRVVLEEHYFNEECLSKKEYTYDVSGNLIDQIETVISQRGPPKKFIVSNLYTRGAKLIQQTQAKNSFTEKTTRFTYNEQGLLCQKIKPDETAIEYTYNHFGEKILEKTSDGNLEYTYHYDKLGNVTHVYDKDANLINECCYHSKVLCQETLVNGLILKKAIDPLKRITQLCLPDGSTVDYSYLGLFLSRIQRNEYAFDHFDYQTSGRLWSYQLPNGKWFDHLYYDKTHDLTNIRTPFYREELSYDHNHHMTKTNIEDAFGTNTNQFSYDPSGQLTSESGIYTHAYSHDSLNNRLSCDASDFTLNDLNQIIKTSDGTELEYDANGNLISKKTSLSTTHFTYDALDRLIEIRTSSKIITFTYDHTHRRMSQTVQNIEDQTFQTLQFLYDNDNEIGAFENNEMIQFKLTSAIPSISFDMIFAIEIDHIPYLTVQNAQGSITALATLDNTLIQSYRYSAFGEKKLLTHEKTPIKNPWTYQSKREFLEFYAFGYRDYDSTLGRWLTPDPSGFADGLNLYAFVLNSPMSFVDLYGLQTSMPFIGFDSPSSHSSYSPQFNYAGHSTALPPPPLIFPDQYHSPLPDLSSVNQKPFGRISFGNGLYNSRNDAFRSTMYLSNLGGGVDVGLAYNRQWTLGLDFLRGAFNRIISFQFPGALTRAGSEFVKEALLFDSKTDANARLFKIGHSDYIHHLEMALNYLNRYHPGVTDKVFILAIAPSTFIKKGKCAKVMHLVSPTDPIPYTNPLKFLGAIMEGTVQFVGGDSPGSHSLQSGYYDRYIGLEIKNFESVFDIGKRE